jgi:hypothetical protein
MHKLRTSPHVVLRTEVTFLYRHFNDKFGNSDVFDDLKEKYHRKTTETHLHI